MFFIYFVQPNIHFSYLIYENLVSLVLPSLLICTIPSGVKNTHLLTYNVAT